MTAIQDLVPTICPTIRCVSNKETEALDASRQAESFHTEQEPSVGHIILANTWLHY